jgi:hypothetical protein
VNTNLLALALVFTVAGLSMSQRRRGVGAWLFGVAGVLYWLCGLGPVAWSLVDGVYHALGGGHQ